MDGVAQKISIATSASIFLDSSDLSGSKKLALFAVCHEVQICCLNDSFHTQVCNCVTTITLFKLFDQKRKLSLFSLQQALWSRVSKDRLKAHTQQQQVKVMDLTATDVLRFKKSLKFQMTAFCDGLRFVIFFYCSCSFSLHWCNSQTRWAAGDTGKSRRATAEGQAKRSRVDPSGEDKRKSNGGEEESDMGRRDLEHRHRNGREKREGREDRPRAER